MPALVRFFLMAVALPFTGCEQQQQALDSYIDAVMLQELNESKMAIAKLEQAVEADDRFGSANTMLARMYQRAGDYEKSAACYERAIETDPSSFEAHFQLGQVYESMSKFTKAAEVYGKACDLEGDHLEAHLGAARCFCASRDYETALTYCRRAEQIDPDSGDVQAMLGRIYQARGDYNQAIAVYLKALEHDADRPELVLGLSEAFVMTERYAQAEELLSLLTQAHPENAAAYRCLGYCYLKLDAVDKAIEAYQRAVAIDNGDWQGHRGLGVAYMVGALRNQDERLRAKAIRQWRLALDAAPNQPQSDALHRLIERFSEKTVE